MKPRQFLVLVVCLFAIGLGAYFAITAWWQPSLPVASLDASKLIVAVQTYTRDLREKSQPLPDSLTLRDLVKGGYLNTNDVSAFEGLEVTFVLSANPNQPQEALIRVRLRDGSQMVVLASGEVQHLPK